MSDSRRKQLEHKAFSIEDLSALRNLPIIQSASIRNDSVDAALHIAQQLDFLKIEFYNLKYPENHAMSLFPVTSSVERGAQTVSWRGFDYFGKSRIYSPEANDIPRVANSTKWRNTNIKPVANSYFYTVDQIEAAIFGNIPLQAELARGSRLSLDQELNRIAWVGDEEEGLMGILTPNKDVSFPIFPTPLDFAAMTSVQILDFVREMTSSVRITTAGVERPDTWAVPTDLFTRLHMTRFNDGDTKSIATWLIDNSGGLLRKIIDVPELNPRSDILRGTAYEATGVSFYYSDDRNSFSIETPVPFDQTPPQAKGLGFEIISRATTAGVLIYYPMSSLIVPLA